MIILFNHNLKEESKLRAVVAQGHKLWLLYGCGFDSHSRKWNIYINLSMNPSKLKLMTNKIKIKKYTEE